MPEQLVFDEVLGERGAVDGDERAFRIRAEAVQLAGDELLSRSALSYDEHGARNLGHARDRVLEPLHGRARAHERRLAVEALAQGGDLAREPLSLQRLLDLLHHPLHGLGLVDEASSAEPDGLDAAVVVAGPGVDDGGDAEASGAHRPQHLEPVHSRHLEIEDHTVHRLGLQGVERLPAAVGDERFVAAHALEIVGVLLCEGRDVVDDQDCGHALSAGSSTMNLLPAPGSVSTRSAPPASSTSRRTMESPRPVPPGLVV